MRTGFRIGFALLCFCTSSTSGASSEAAADPVLRFRSSTTEERAIPLSELRRSCPPRAVEVDDPYHARSMRYFTMPLRCVLERGFATLGGADALRGQGLRWASQSGG